MAETNLNQQENTSAENLAIEVLSDQIAAREASVEASPKRKRGRPAKAKTSPTVAGEDA